MYMRSNRNIRNT